MKYRLLATDYDGTIAHHGAVDAATVEALNKFKESGRKVILVTGREIPDLHSVFSETAIFDLIVAENGALLYWPLTKVEKPVAPPPPPRFAEMLRQKAVNTLSVGRVIVATIDVYEKPVRESIAELNLDLEIIPNKGALMVLPRGIDKGFGLAAALRELDLDPSQVVAVGDAENDHSLFHGAGFSAAVANALPELKTRASWVTPSGHGAGVRELIERILKEDPA
jgi:hydroxymethylpyrimidine pyrophosphatase-like HAD family hydrolase